MNQRVLKFDQVKATGLNPVEVAKCGQSVQVYNPQFKKYVMVSRSSPKLSENESNFISIDESYKGGGKRFLLEQLCENEYHIKSMDDDGKEENGFIYVSEHVSSGVIESSANVLRSEKIIGKKELYVFEFLSHSEQKGVYKIRCKGNGKVLFGSDDRGNYLKADKRDREKSNQIWFQLNIKPHMDINVAVVESNCHVLSGNGDLPMYIDEVCNKSQYEFTQRFQDGREKLAGILQKVSVNEYATLKAESELLAVKVNTAPTIIKSGKTRSISTSLRTHEQLSEQKLEIEFNGNKFEGYKVIAASSAGSSVVAIEEDELEKNS